MELNELKLAYCYDPEGYFSDSHIAQPNPRKVGEYFYPDDCTEVKPKLRDGFFYRIAKRGDVKSDWIEEPMPTKADDFLKIRIPHASQTMHNNLLRAQLRYFVEQNPQRYREKQVIDKDTGAVDYLTIEEIPEPTEAEKLEALKAEIKAKRKTLLDQTDYLLVADYPISLEKLEAVKVYRTALRNITEQKGYPNSVKWPVMPEL